jgi:hypothetical protein
MAGERCARAGSDASNVRRNLISALKFRKAIETEIKPEPAFEKRKREVLSGEERDPAVRAMARDCGPPVPRVRK